MCLCRYSLVVIASLVLSLARAEEHSAQVSERHEMARNIILDEAAARGYSGDSAKLDFEKPCTAVMRLYSVSKGKSMVVQTSRTTIASRSFEVGFLFRPSKDATRSLSFIFYDHDRPSKGLGSNLGLQDGKSYPVREKFATSVSSMGAVVATGEFVVFYTAEKALTGRLGSLGEVSEGIEDGYIITVTISN